MCCAEQLYREGKLPKRICHCDTKVSNMLFDEDGNVLCVIDLDTVMPSFIFSDFGDFLRTAANTGKEDDPDLDKVTFNMEIFKAFTKGYIESARSFLTPIEIEYLPYAATLFPYMQAVRFLADYINGDTYYQTQYKEHNLVRTKAQYKLYTAAKACCTRNASIYPVIALKALTFVKAVLQTRTAFTFTVCPKHPVYPDGSAGSYQKYKSHSGATAAFPTYRNAIISSYYLPYNYPILKSRTHP